MSPRQYIQESILPSPKWVNEKAASILTGLSVHTLRSHRFKGKGIPYTKVGRSVRYALDDVQAYMTAHRVSFGE